MLRRTPNTPTRIKRSEAGLGTKGAVIVGLAASAIALFAYKGIKDFDIVDKIVDKLKEELGLEGKETSDPAPKGTVRYEGQIAETSSTSFRVQVGTGTAIVPTFALQEYDKRGTILNGDFKKGPNGKSYARDPQDNNIPADIRVTMQYCADGKVSERGQKLENGENGPVEEIYIYVGQVAICNGYVDMANVYNATAIGESEDVPKDRHGPFVAHVLGGTTTAAIAGPCPTTELEKFAGNKEGVFDPVFEKNIKAYYAGQHDILPDKVTIVPGTIGKTAPEVQENLTKRLESYANKVDPKTGKHHPSINIDLGATGGTGAKDSCYIPAGAENLTDTSKDGR